MCRSVPILRAAVAAIGFLAALTACTTSSPAPAAPAVAEELTEPQTAPEAAETWRLSSGGLVIHVGKTGRLARLGHNHLVSSTQLTGNAWVEADQTLRAQVQVLVADLKVDDPSLRAVYNTPSNATWADTYTSIPSAKNIADTRKNMLGPRVLDAKNHPALLVSMTAPAAGAEFDAASAGNINATLLITVRGGQSQIPIALLWERTGPDRMAWQTEFKTSHSALGLTPFSALGGALAVADDMTLEVRGVLERSGTVQTDDPMVQNLSEN